MFATRNPPSVQRIPWPTVDEDDIPSPLGHGHTNPYYGFDSWVLNEEELPWLVDPDGSSFL